MSSETNTTNNCTSIDIEPTPSTSDTCNISKVKILKEDRDRSSSVLNAISSSSSSRAPPLNGEGKGKSRDSSQRQGLVHSSTSRRHRKVLFLPSLTPHASRFFLIAASPSCCCCCRHKKKRFIGHFTQTSSSFPVLRSLSGELYCSISNSISNLSFANVFVTCMPDFSLARFR
jgi:hypothetical protein